MVLFVDENENVLPSSGPSGASNNSTSTNGGTITTNSTTTTATDCDSPLKRSMSFRRERYKSFRGRDAKSCGRFGGYLNGTSRAKLSLSASNNNNSNNPVRSATLSPNDLPAVFYTTPASAADGSTTNVVSVKKRRGFFFRVRHFLRNDDGDFISLAS